jgi:SAM-dependent methyltransferase
VDALSKLISARFPHAQTLLDVGCGTGRHLELFRRAYRVEGLDASPELLAAAHERLPDIPFHVGDIRTFELGHQFDVVTCLFATIGYARTTAGLRVALTQLASHVADAGLLLVEPWLAPTVPWHFAEAFAEDPRQLVARVGRGLTEGRLSVSETDYLVVEDDAAEHFRERHELGLATRRTTTLLFAPPGSRSSGTTPTATRDSSSERRRLAEALSQPAR